MSQIFGPHQKVTVTEQSTGGYSVCLYDVECKGGKYVYGLDDMVNNIMVEDVEFIEDMDSNCISESELREYSMYKIESKEIYLRLKKSGNGRLAEIQWDEEKKSFYDWD